MPLEERELHVAISEKETCPIHRDWHDEETDFKEKSVRYTEIRHTISHMRSRMRESRTSGSVRGVPCERYVYSPRQKLQRGGVMLLKRPRRSMFEKNGIFCKKSNL